MTLRVNGSPLPNALDRARDARQARESRLLDEGHARLRQDDHDDDTPAFVIPGQGAADDVRSRALGRGDGERAPADGPGRELGGSGSRAGGPRRSISVGPNGLPISSDDGADGAATAPAGSDPARAALDAQAAALDAEAAALADAGGLFDDAGEAVLDPAQDPGAGVLARGPRAASTADQLALEPHGRAAGGVQIELSPEALRDAHGPAGKLGARLGFSAGVGLPSAAGAAAPGQAPPSPEAAKQSMMAQSMLQTAATNLASTLPRMVDLRVLDTLGLDVTRGLELRLGLGREREGDRDLDGSLLSHLGADPGSVSRAAEHRVVPVEPGRPIGPQIADAVQKLASDAAADGIIRFRGGDLGSFTAHVVQEGLGVTVRIVPDDPAGRALFSQRLPEVRDALVRAGIRLDALDVRTSSDGRSGGRDPRERDLQQEETDIFKELD